MERMSFSDVRAIVFEKDGTLIDFDAFWVAVSERALDILFRGLDDALDELHARGIRLAVVTTDNSEITKNAFLLSA